MCCSDIRPRFDNCKFRMSDDAYRGHTILDNGDVLEYYDHRDEYVPQQVVERARPKGNPGNGILHYL